MKNKFQNINFYQPITDHLNTEMKEKPSVNKLIEKYGVSKTQMYTILKPKSEMKEEWLE